MFSVRNKISHHSWLAEPKIHFKKSVGYTCILLWTSCYIPFGLTFLPARRNQKYYHWLNIYFVATWNLSCYKKIVLNDTSWERVRLTAFLFTKLNIKKNTAGSRKLCFALAKHQTAPSGLPTQAESYLTVGRAWIYYLLAKLLRSTKRFQPLLRILSQISLASCSQLAHKNIAVFSHLLGKN